MTAEASQQQQQEIDEYPITKIPIEKLQFDSTNPNKPTKEQIAAIKKSFKRFGFLVPITVNESYQIGDGEHRALIYKDLGIKEIPAYVVNKINDDIERRLLRQTLNKLRGEHEVRLDAHEMALIFRNQKLDDLAQLIAQDREKLENALTRYEGIHFQHEDNFDVKGTLEKLQPETKLGDIWDLGPHRIICADCSDPRSIKRLFSEGKKKADVILTDPPYNISDNMSHHLYASIDGNKLDDLEHAEWDKNIDLRPALDVMLTTLAPDCTVYIFTSQYLAGQIWQWMSEWSKYRNYLVYCKTNPMPSLMKRYWTWATELICAATRGRHTFNFVEGTHNYNYLIYNKTDPATSTEHLTQKPVQLLAEIIEHSSNPDFNIYDPFLGSGSTLIACEQTKRCLFGVEIDPHFVEVCVKRWEAFTGKKAELIRA